jgi:hypothetical protein
MARRVRGVEVGVEDGDGEAAPVKDAGEPEHGVDVALVWEREREQYHVAATMSVVGGGGPLAVRGDGWRRWCCHGFAECCALAYNSCVGSGATMI